MAAETPSTVKYGPFKGINNIDRVLAVDELLHAVNVDIDRNGTVSRRKGSSRVIDAVNSHSLWGRDRNTAFFVEDMNLKQIVANVDGSLTTTTVIAENIFQLFQPVSYVNVDGTVYLSNGLISCKVRPDGIPAYWGTHRPASSPVLAAIPGSLPAGWYRVGLTFVDDLGEESGMTDPVSIELLTDGGITITSVAGAPGGTLDHVASVRVYVSDTNGEVLYRHSTFTVGPAAFNITSKSATLGGQANTLHLDRMIPAELLEYYNGRIYGAVGSVVWFTEALRYGLHNPQRNFLLFSRPVAIIKAVVDGLYIATDERTYFYAGAAPDAFTPRIVLPYGAIKNTGITFPMTGQASGRRASDAGTTVGWFSERGFVKGAAGGAVQVGDKERIMIGMYGFGGAVYRETDGIRQVIGTMKNPTAAGLTSRDFAEAEVRRHAPVTD